MLLVLAILLTTLAANNVSTAVSAHAEPGNPGVPGEPSLIFEEGFEERPDNNVVLLSNYVGVNGQRYTGDAAWVSLRNCNGFVVSAASPNPGVCQFFSSTQGVAAQLAAYNGSESALSAYTDGDPGANRIQFRTVDPIDIGGPGRFITFSVDAGAMNCQVSAPLLHFSYEVDGNETPISGAAINPCTDPRGQDVGANSRVGTFAANGAFLSTGSAVGIVMRNANGSGTGNDGAIDNIRILDVTPQLDKSFSPESVPAGGISTLTLTVTNTSELAEKDGWAFTDTLPEGLVVADPANRGGSCDATVSAEAGSSDIAITGGRLAAGEASCTITVDVTSASPVGPEPSPVVYESCAENISDQVGINDPGCAQVEFYSTAELSIEKSSDATENTRVGDAVTYTVTATNTGDGDFTEEDPAVVFDDLSGVLDDADYNEDATASQPGDVSYASPLLSWSGPLASGESVELTYTVTLKPGGDGGVRNVSWAPGDVPPGEDPPTPSCDPRTEDGLDPETGEPCGTTELEIPRLQIDKTADRAELHAIGEPLEYTVTVTNIGPGDYTEQAPASFTDDLSNVLDAATFNDDATASVGEVSYTEPTLSWEGPLAAGESATITYTVTYSGEGDHNLHNLACVPETEVASGAPPCDFVEVPGSGLTQWKQVESPDAPVVAGSVLTYTLFFKNDGGAAATVDAIDDLTHVTDDADVTAEPVATNGLTATRDGNRISIAGSVAPGETASVTYEVTLRADGERGDDIAANYLLENDPENPPTPPEDPTCEPTDEQLADCTVTPVAAVEYSKSVEASTDPVDAGTVLTYTVTVENTGAATAPVSREDVLTDVLDDADLTSAPVSDTDSVTVSDVTDGRFEIGGELAAGETATITYEVTVKPESERGNNSAGNFLVNPGETPPEECAEDAPECTVTPLPLIEADKTVDPESGTTVLAGQEVTYTLTFTNSGNAPGSVDYTDNLAGVLDDAALTAGPSASDPALDPALNADETLHVSGTLAIGETVTVSYTVTVGEDGERGDNVLRNVLAKTGTEDSECGDDSVTCTENPIPELDSWKTVDADSTPVAEGTVLTYTLHFENIGNADKQFSRDDVLTEVLDDADVTGQPAASSDALTVSDIVDGRFTISGTLAPGEHATVSYQVTAKPDGQRGDDRLVNFLVDPGQEPPTECTPGEGERADCTINHVSDVTVDKSSDPDSGTEVNPGQEVTYTLTFTNRSTNPDAAPVEIDYTDHMVDVLDDAELVNGPTVSNDDLTAATDGDTIRITGAVPTGEVYTVTYTVEVKSYDAQGNHSLGNVVAITGEDPVCAPDSPLCTDHDVPEPPTTRGNLPQTGGEISATVIAAALALLLAGGVLLVTTRRRRKAHAGDIHQDVTLDDLM